MDSLYFVLQHQEKDARTGSRHLCVSQRFGFITMFHLLRRAEEGAITQPAEERVIQAVPYEEHSLWSSRWGHNNLLLQQDKDGSVLSHDTISRLSKRTSLRWVWRMGHMFSLQPLGVPYWNYKITWWFLCLASLKSLQPRWHRKLNVPDWLKTTADTHQRWADKLVLHFKPGLQVKI